MFIPTKVQAALAGLAVAGGAMVAVALGPAGSAVGQSSPPTQLQIQVNSPAALVAKGTSVDVSVTFSCSANLAQDGFVQVFLTERVGHEIATGVGSLGVNCTGTTQTVEVSVPPVSGGNAFKKGAAIAQGIVGACTADFSSCPSEQVEPTIDIG